MAKTLTEKSYEKNAPDEPLAYEMFDNATRIERSLLTVVGEAEDMIKARRSGCAITVNGYVANLSALDRARVFGMIWDDILKQITYWEFHARRYFTIPKELQRRMESVRTEIDEYQNC